MDQQKEKALLGWVSGLINVGDVDSMTKIDYGSCFINILQYMDSTTTVQDYPTTKEKVLATQKFLERFYYTSFSHGEVVNFDILLEPDPEAKAVVGEETAKVLLLLLCAGIQDKNTEILTAAIRVDASLHWDVRQLIEAVIGPDEPTISLPSDFAKVFLECSDAGPNDSADFFCRLANVNTVTTSRATSAVATARLASLSDAQDSNLGLHIASLSLTSLNDSLVPTSPPRVGTGSTPLEELVNSPQLARKIMRREKEYRLCLERQLKEKEGALKKCQHDLHSNTLICDELELDLRESQNQLQRKDCRIHDLEQQVQRLRTLQDQLNELGAVEDSNLELERDVESLRSISLTAEMMNKYCQSLMEENKALYEDINNLNNKVSQLEARNSESGKAQLKSEKLKVQVGELQAEVEALREELGKIQEEKRALETDMDVLKRVNEQQRQQLMDRSGSVGDVSGSGGESMGVVTDKLIEELRVELDMMRNSWYSPDVHGVVLRDLETNIATVKCLEEECSELRLKLQQVKTAEAWEQEAKALVNDTEEYWKLQLKSMHDDIESEMKYQRLAYENDLAEQRAEYETRLRSALEEQESIRLEEKALLEDQLDRLQEELNKKQAEFSRVLAEKEAEFRENMTTQEVKTEKQLASLQQYLQQEAESQQSIRDLVNEDRAKITHLETQMADRCREFEELLQTEQQEKEEIVKKVVEESQQKVSTVQHTLEQERAQSLEQIRELQRQSKELKQQHHEYVRRTENLQHQLSDLESQKDEAVLKLEREVDTRISVVKHMEEENCMLKAKVVELESTVSLQKSELITLKTIDQEMSPEGKKHSYEDKVRSLSGKLDLLKVECQTLQAENKDLQEKAALTTQSMAEQLKRYERKCQQDETQHKVLEKQVQAFLKKEAAWKADAEKIKELSARVEELETKATTSEAAVESKPPSLSSPRLKAQPSQSNVSLQFDESFNTTLPRTPGALEKQIIQSLSRSSSGTSHVIGRSSTCSVGSSKSVIFVPTGAGRMFSCEDEPDSPTKYEWGRLNDLQSQSTLSLPHTKSSAKTRNVKDQGFEEGALQQPGYPSAKGKQSSPHSSSSESTLSRKRKPDTMETEEAHVTCNALSEGQGRKLARRVPMYQKPGPPTPYHDHHSKHGGKSPQDRRQSLNVRRSPRGHDTPRSSSAENLMLGQHADNVMCDTSLTPAKPGGKRSTSLQPSFSTRASSFCSSKQVRPTNMSPSAAGSDRKNFRSPRTAERSKVKRKPLTTRNSLQTNL